MTIEHFWKTLLRAPEGAGGGGDDTAAGGGGEDTVAGGGGDDTAAGGGGGDTPGAVGKWWDDGRFDDDTRAQLKSLGLQVDDPLDAVGKLAGMERSAKAKLGRGADQLIDKPAEGQDVAEWLRQHGDMFGVPGKPEDYKIELPEGWGKDSNWDSAFEAEARKIAHEAGVPNAALQQMTELYAGKLANMLEGAEQELAAANAEMMSDLQKSWGDQLNSRIALAQQAAGVLAEKTGMDAAALQNLNSVLSAKAGDANTIKLFAAIGQMMGEDQLVSVPGAGGMAMTPDEAAAKIEEMKKPGSDFGKAIADKREGKNPDAYKAQKKEWDRLHKIAFPDG